MNIGVPVAAAAALGYYVYSSTSFSGAVSLKGKTVLITGAGSGVGRLTALRFAEQGASIVLWDLNEQGMKETKAMIMKSSPKIRCTYAVVDVSSPTVVYESARNANRWASPSYVSVLVNNAGIVSGKALLETEDSKIRKTFEVNVMAHFWTTKAFLPKMISEGFGHIVRGRKKLQNLRKHFLLLSKTKIFSLSFSMLYVFLFFSHSHDLIHPLTRCS